MYQKARLCFALYCTPSRENGAPLQVMKKYVESVNIIISRLCSKDVVVSLHLHAKLQSWLQILVTTNHTQCSF